MARLASLSQMLLFLSSAMWIFFYFPYSFFQVLSEFSSISSPLWICSDSFSGIVFCLAFNVLAVTICWIRGGGEFYSLFAAAYMSFSFIGLKV